MRPVELVHGHPVSPTTYLSSGFTWPPSGQARTPSSAAAGWLVRLRPCTSDAARTTPSFQAVADRIVTSRFAADLRNDDGHIWLPLRVSADRSGVTIVDELLEQIEEIRAVVAGAELPKTGPS